MNLIGNSNHGNNNTLKHTILPDSKEQSSKAAQIDNLQVNKFRNQQNEITRSITTAL